ncbi:MAG: hypothetical protein AAGH45_03645 [Pseudomonadota bacterium]
MHRFSVFAAALALGAALSLLGPVRAETARTLPKSFEEEHKARPGIATYKKLFEAPHPPDTLNHDLADYVESRSVEVASQLYACDSVQLLDWKNGPRPILDRLIEEEILSGQITDVWRTSVAVDACGRKSLINYIGKIYPDGQTTMEETLRGLTYTSPAIQADMVPLVERMADLTIEAEGRPCPTVYRPLVIDAFVDASTIDGLVHVFGSVMEGTWSESWSVLYCDVIMEVDVTFTAEGGGTKLLIGQGKVISEKGSEL